jgi:hypothetical protein
MQSYHRLIEETLKGDTPKEKYEYLIDVLNLLYQTAYPRRNTPEESWLIIDVVNEINSKHLVEYQKEYKY